MSARRRKKRKFRQLVLSELELMPMLNVFLAIIPLLLLSAAFVPVSIIKTSLPAGGVADVESLEDGPLELIILIRKEAYVLEANGVVSRTIPRSSAGAPGPARAGRAQLSDALKEIAAAYPGHREVRIIAEGTTRYEEIIDVMDISRAVGLPDAALAEGV